jgi:hypothetical protein
MRLCQLLFAFSPFAAVTAFAPSKQHQRRHRHAGVVDAPPPSLWHGRCAHRRAGALAVASSAAVPAADTSCPPSVTAPNASPNPWEVHKFGGASLADAALYRKVGDLLVSESNGRAMKEEGSDEERPSGPIPTMAVVSARGGMTDQLVAVVDSALEVGGTLQFSFFLLDIAPWRRGRGSKV